MSALLIDTHVWAWAVTTSEKISDEARRSIKNASKNQVSTVSAFDTTQKIRLESWPEMEPHIGTLKERVTTLAAPLSIEMASLAGLLDWDHRDPFDRLITATAPALKCKLVSKDPQFDLLATRDDWQGGSGRRGFATGRVAFDRPL